MTKVLILRFSAIGDIVLTTPVIRALKQQANVELHYATKKAYFGVIKDNPYIDQIHLLTEEGFKPLAKQLKAENFDYVIDLHNNQRTWLFKRTLGVKSYAFHKANIAKWLMVNFKMDRLPKEHIVDRYMATVKKLGVINDNQGLDFFIHKKDEVNVENLFDLAKNTFVAFVIGAKHNTKKLPLHKIQAICKRINRPVILVGGPQEAEEGKAIADTAGTHVFNACGKLNLGQSASVVKQAYKVITHDTGMMHIAAAFKKNIISVWGNTIPAFGMYPYQSPEERMEVEGLSCRPCSKIGYKSCPKKHFNCMEKIDESHIITSINE